MNKRIEELAEEAAKYSATMFLPTGENGDKLFVEKFAELIVKECLDCMENSEGDLDFAMWKIRKDFGVEE